MYALFGLDPNTFANSNDNFLAMVHPDDRERMGQAMAAALANPGPFLQRYRVTRPDGVLVYIQGEGNVVRGVDGRADLLYGFVQDITVRKEAENALEETASSLRAANLELEGLSNRLQLANEFKTNFLNMAAHDLNNIVTPMRLSLRSLHNSVDAVNLPGATRPMAQLDRTVERIAGFLADLLDAARLQSGSLKIKPTQVDFSGAMSVAVDAATSEAAAKKIRIKTDIPPSLTAWCDARRLDQVMTNILNNAVKFTPSGGTIQVILSATAEGVGMAIADTGPGIRQEDIPKLFQPFTQLGAEAQGKHSGTGLGLFICKGIVEAHGGRIWCDSQEGRGSTFSITLPNEPTRSTPRIQTPRHDPPE